MRSATEIVSSMPNAVAVDLTSTATTTAVATLSDIAARTFWPTMVSVRRASVNVPVWIAVARRLPSAPKMFPLSPMAAGTSTSSPGSSSSVPVMDARARPAPTLVTELRPNATRLCRAATGSGPSRPRSGPSNPCALRTGTNTV